MTGDTEGKKKDPKKSIPKPTADENPEKPPISLDEQLKKLQAEVEQKKKAIAQQELELNVTNKACGEINKAVESFANGFEKLRKDIGDIENYFKKKLSMIDAVVDAKMKNEIGKKIGEVEEEINNKQNEVNELESQVAENERAFNEAEAELKKSKDEYTSAINLQKDMGIKLKELDNTRKLIENEEEAKNFVLMSFLIQHEKNQAGLGKLIEETKKLVGDAAWFSPGFEKEKAVEKFKTSLEKKWRLIYDKEKEIDLKTKEKAMKEAKEAYEKSQKELVEIEKARRNNILEKLKEIKEKEV
jgi:chromosome segregation ATPase